jgi:hypothetical protein
MRDGTVNAVPSLLFSGEGKVVGDARHRRLFKGIMKNTTFSGGMGEKAVL